MAYNLTILRKLFMNSMQKIQGLFCPMRNSILTIIVLCSINSGIAQSSILKRGKASNTKVKTSNIESGNTIPPATNKGESKSDFPSTGIPNKSEEEMLIKELDRGLKFIPYVRSVPIKPNPIGNYPKLQNAPSWDGREPGNYSIRFKIKTLTPLKATPKITNIYAGDTVFLADHNIGGKYLRDTAVIDKYGVANFLGTKKLQRGMYLFVFPQRRDFFEFIVDDDQDFQIDFDTAWSSRDYYGTMNIIGSEQNSAFLKYQIGKMTVIDKLMALDQLIENDSMAEQSIKDTYDLNREALLAEKGNFDSAFILANPSHVLAKFLLAMINVPFPSQLPTLSNGLKDSSFSFRWYRSHYWDHIDFGDDGLLRMPVNIIKQKLDFFFDKVIVPDADTCINVSQILLSACKNTIEMEKYLVWYLTNRFESSNVMGMDRAFVSMALNTYCQGKSWWTDSVTVAKMCENAFRRAHTLIGETAPDLELKDIHDQWINTKSIQGPYVVMVFWDPTCGHCKEVLPKLAKIYEDNKDKGWKVIALSSGDKRKEWLEYYNTHPETQTLTHLIRGEVQTQKFADNLYSYYVIASPTIYVLDGNRKIVANRIDVDKMEEFLKHIDAEKKK